MVDQTTLYPLEFFVEATPLSLQASRKSRQRWSTVVKSEARERIQNTDEIGFLDDRPLSLTIYYFCAASMKGDVDNIIKPIMDALVHVAYLDDRNIESVVAQKFEPEVDWSFADPSGQLAVALDVAPPVVYIRVDDDLSWRRR